jgi:hypothetical protein
LNVDTFNEIVDLNLSDKNNAMALSRFWEAASYAAKQFANIL